MKQIETPCNTNKKQKTPKTFILWGFRDYFGFFKMLWKAQMVPVVGLEPTRLLGNGFWIRRVYQFHHTGMSG